MSNWGTGGGGELLGGLGNVGRRPSKAPFDEKKYAREQINKIVSELREQLRTKQEELLGQSDESFIGFSGYSEGVKEEPNALFEKYKLSLGDDIPEDWRGMKIEIHHYSYSGREYPMSAGDALVVVPANKISAGRNDYLSVVSMAEGFGEWLKNSNSNDTKKPV